MAPFEQADIFFPAEERKERKGNRQEKECSSGAELSVFAEPTEVAGYTKAAGFAFAEFTKPT